jgi:hypothetical protein
MAMVESVRMQARTAIAAVLAILGVVAISAGGSGRVVAAAEPIEFNRDVRPILSDKCFRCHGPDSASRQGDLRLDRREDAITERDGHAAIVPGKAEQSVAFLRILSADETERMPPVDSGLVVTPAERETLRRWIAAGAKYESHWSLITPEPSQLPPVKQQAWPRNAIDRFVLAKLEQEGLRPSPEADAATLCRRLHLDLTGLPPTPETVEEFVRDYAASPPGNEQAYAALVDKLLASPRYGERMAAPWLDAARFADTNGYQTDGPRRMWRWRDWVIDAFNQNLPYDQFTLEQLAGDLLPEPTLEQRIATGFNRNHRINAEGGIIPEEFLVEYVVDRVETTATVWLGLTLGCARCHDHKYDPVSQRDFYRLYAFFNRVPEPGKGVRDDNSPPFLSAPTVEQQIELKRHDAAVAAAAKTWQAVEPRARKAERAWAPTVQQNITPWTVTDGLTLRFRFDDEATDDVTQAAAKVVAGKMQFGPGPFSPALELDGNTELDTTLVPAFDSERPFSTAVWIKPAEAATQTVYASMDADMSSLGFELRLVDGRVELVFAARVLDDVLRLRTKPTVPVGEWSHVAWAYAGGKSPNAVTIYIDGRAVEFDVLADLWSNKTKATEPLVVGGGGTAGRFHGRVADLRCYDHVLTADEAAVVFCGLSLRSLGQQSPHFGNPASAVKFWEYFLQHDGRAEFGSVREAWLQARRERDAYVASLPTVMVMHDVPNLRQTFVLKRGEYDKPGEAVEAGVPEAFGLPLPSKAKVDRLALARWLVDPRHPLTARVAVNRLWQQLFGVGLVKTVEDFGSQGEWPVHRELLDWLAVEFQRPERAGETAWDVKRLLKLIVMSATYRQSSHVSPALAARDPENRLLARGARFRLSAEAIRDSALFAAGLLRERVGGPSVKPYQPAGLWEELATGTVKYEQDHGDDLYRRSLYTYCKRTVAQPTMATFDAAARESCVVRTSRTNTPLQALNLMNDVTFVEAARELAARTLREAGSTPGERIALAARWTLGREPTAAETEVLRRGFERRLAAFRADRKQAEALVHQGEAPIDPRLDVAEWAAYTTVAQVLMNLDEFVTHE